MVVVGLVVARKWQESGKSLELKMPLEGGG